MIRKLWAVGLALVALLAIGASSATAAGERFHSEITATILTGTSEGSHIFGLPNGSFKIECTDVEFKGTSLGEAGGRTNKTMTLHPTYSGCTSSLGASPVDTAGCNYVIGSETTATKHLPMEIECTTGSAIKFTSPGCTMSFGSQKNGGGFSVKNEGAGSSRDMTWISTTTLTFTKSGFGCFAVEGSQLTLSGATTLKGYEDKGVSGNIDEGATYTEGSQVGTWWE